MIFLSLAVQIQSEALERLLSQGSQLYGQNKGVVVDRIKRNLIEVFRLFPLLLPNEGKHCEALLWQDKIFL